jgi:hypothetical protein
MYQDDEDRKRFLTCMGEVCGRAKESKIFQNLTWHGGELENNPSEKNSPLPFPLYPVR